MLRYDKIVRFTALAFACGAILGLAGGLVFGDGRDTATANGGATSNAGTAVGATPGSGAAGSPMTAQAAKEIGANEFGLIPVLEYHKIGTPESQWTRTPANFRKDLALLQAAGFFPINLADLAGGAIEVPAGKSPVVLTFDDSSPGQFRVLDDGSVDPDSAVGIMQQAVKSGWASKASFYVLLDVRPDDNVIFGQPDAQTQKLRDLVSWGYEVGGHTVTHLNLKKASLQESRKQLAVAAATIEKYVGGSYKVRTMSVPFGEYPKDDSLLASGEYEGMTYAYKAALKVGGGSTPSPFTAAFRPLHIPRIQVTGSALQDMVDEFTSNPELRYVSDGDPAAISAPKVLAEKLGEPLPDQGRPVIRY
jgi:peptidoglycan/xylan/chitin deacetylase (PgdA/CDA1 family)